MKMVLPMPSMLLIVIPEMGCVWMCLCNVHGCALGCLHLFFGPM